MRRSLMQALGSNSAFSHPKLEVEFAQLSDPGSVRGHNEDYCGYVEPLTPAQAQAKGWLFVLADGVGGQDLGEVASRTAVESALAGFRKSAGRESQTALLRRLVQTANHEVYETGRSAGPGGVAMATTIVACSLRYDRVVIAHVGDSRCYLIRQGHAAALTRDHTISADQVRLGIMTAKEGSESANRHVLSRSLGIDLFTNVEIDDQLLMPQDILLLCSDGLHNSIEKSDIDELLHSGADLDLACRNLVALANERDGGDNITVQVIRIRSVERMGIYRGRQYRLR